MDAGNFAGVAVYVQGDEVVLVSEMEAGWYRYISQWRLHRDGTIRPRFGFAGIDDSCICDIHQHHAYWRLNFDIGAESRNSVQEWNDHPGPSRLVAHDAVRVRRRGPPTCRASGGWSTRRPAPGTRSSRVITTARRMPSGWGLLGAAAAKGADRRRAGVHLLAGPAPARIDTFVNGDDITDRDVVVWYVGHFKHDVDEDPHHDDGPPTAMSWDLSCGRTGGRPRRRSVMVWTKARAEWLAKWRPTVHHLSRGG